MPDDKKVDEPQAAVELLSDILRQQLAKSPELAAKQAQLLALLKAKTKPLSTGPDPTSLRSPKTINPQRDESYYDTWAGRGQEQQDLEDLEDGLLASEKQPPQTPPATSLPKET